MAIFQQARRSDDRVQKLLEENAISRADVDKATEALAVAESGIARAEAAIAEGQKELIAAEKTAQYHSARLHDTKISAPFDGLIVRRNREPGDVVMPGSSMLTLISTDELWISAWVDETEMSKLANNQPARVLFRSSPNHSYSGTVTRMGREADRETREFLVDVRVLELPENWAVGQRAEAFIEVGQRDDTIVIPATLLVRHDGESGVFVDSDGVANWKVLDIGIRNRNAVEVIGGLEAGDVIVSPVNASTSLTEGRRVSLEVQP